MWNCDFWHHYWCCCNWMAAAAWPKNKSFELFCLCCLFKTFVKAKKTDQKKLHDVYKISFLWPTTDINVSDCDQSNKIFVVCCFLKICHRSFFRHQPSWRAQTSQVKNVQTLRWRHVQVRVWWWWWWWLHSSKESCDRRKLVGPMMMSLKGTLNTVVLSCLHIFTNTVFVSSLQQFIVWPGLWFSERLLWPVSESCLVQF